MKPSLTTLSSSPWVLHGVKETSSPVTALTSFSIYSPGGVGRPPENIISRGGPGSAGRTELLVTSLSWSEEGKGTDGGKGKNPKDRGTREVGHPIKKCLQRLPWWSSGWDSIFSLQGAQVQLLVKELRSRKPRGSVIKKKMSLLFPLVQGYARWLQPGCCPMSGTCS